MFAENPVSLVASPEAGLPRAPGFPGDSISAPRAQSLMASSWRCARQPILATLWGPMDGRRDKVAASTREHSHRRRSHSSMTRAQPRANGGRLCGQRTFPQAPPHRLARAGQPTYGKVGQGLPRPTAASTRHAGWKARIKPNAEVGAGEHNRGAAPGSHPKQCSIRGWVTRGLQRAPNEERRLGTARESTTTTRTGAPERDSMVGGSLTGRLLRKLRRATAGDGDGQGAQRCASTVHRYGQSRIIRRPFGRRYRGPILGSTVPEAGRVVSAGHLRQFSGSPMRRGIIEANSPASGCRFDIRNLVTAAGRPHPSHLRPRGGLFHQ